MRGWRRCSSIAETRGGGGGRDRDGRAPCFAPCPPVSGHPSLRLLLYFRKTGRPAVPIQTSSTFHCWRCSLRVRVAGGRFPEVEEEVKGRMSRHRGTWRESAARRPRPRAPQLLRRSFHNRPMQNAASASPTATERPVRTQYEDFLRHV